LATTVSFFAGAAAGGLMTTREAGFGSGGGASGIWLFSGSALGSSFFSSGFGSSGLASGLGGSAAGGAVAAGAGCGAEAAGGGAGSLR
jgi:hypothetical protein